MEKPVVKIEDWAVVESLVPPNYENLQPGRRLVGYVFGHPGATAGQFIYTSPILSVNKGSIETLHTVYVLGDSSNAYKMWKRDQDLAAA
jgi:hypothetical protein